MASTPTCSTLAQPLLSCCSSLDSSLSLLHCVNASLAATEVASVSAAAPYTRTDGQFQGPSLSVVILTRATQEIYDYASWSLFLQALYAERHGYTLLPLPHSENTSNPDYSLHRKLAPMLEALDSPNIGGALHADYLVWMDADLVVLDLSLRLEVIAAAYPRAHILMSVDTSAPANTGMIVVRNTAWAREFLEEWRAEHATNPQASTDQIGFAAVYRRRFGPHASPSVVSAGGKTKGNGKGKDRDKIALLPEHVLNSQAPPMTRQQPSHQVLHLAAESTQLRQAVFKYGVVQVCAAASVGAGTGQLLYPAQLGMTRPFLLQATIEAYRSEALSAIIALERAAAVTSTQVQAMALQPTPLLRSLRHSVSKYCFALAHSPSSHQSSATTEAKASEESLSVRLRAHSAAAAYISNLRSYRLRAGQDQPADKDKDKGKVKVKDKDKDKDKSNNVNGDGVSEDSQAKAQAQSLSEIIGHEEWEAFPEQLKLVIELGFDAHGAIPLTAAQESHDVAQFLDRSLSILRVAVHPSQAHYVVEMQAGLLLQLGQQCLAAGKADAAKAYLLRCVGLHLVAALDDEETGALAGAGALAGTPAVATATATATATVANGIRSSLTGWPWPPESDAVGWNIREQLLLSLLIPGSVSAPTSASSASASAHITSLILSPSITGDLKWRVAALTALAGAFCMFEQHFIGVELFSLATGFAGAASPEGSKSAPHGSSSAFMAAGDYVNWGICLREGWKVQAALARVYKDKDKDKDETSASVGVGVDGGVESQGGEMRKSAVPKKVWETWWDQGSKQLRKAIAAASEGTMDSEGQAEYIVQVAQSELARVRDDM